MSVQGSEVRRLRAQPSRKNVGLQRGAARLCFVLALLLCWIGQAGAETYMIGLTVPPSHVWTKTIDRFAGNMAKETKDRITFKVVPLGKLGNEVQMLDMIQSGALPMVVLPVATMANREEAFLGWLLPYLFKNVEEAGAAAKLPAARQMLASLEPHGIVGVGYTFAGMRHVLSLKPVSSPKDLADKKVRTFPSPILKDWWLANGAAPTALPLGEVAPSLMTNLLDALDADLDIIVSLKFYQQAPHLALTNHGAFLGAFAASKKWWEKLSADDRNLIAKVYDEAQTWSIGVQAKAETDNLEVLKKEKVGTTEINVDSFKEVGKQITAKYTAQNKLIGQFAQEVQKSRP